jgi:hypothetical protein
MPTDLLNRYMGSDKKNGNETSTEQRVQGTSNSSSARTEDSSTNSEDEYCSADRWHFSKLNNGSSKISSDDSVDKTCPARIGMEKQAAEGQKKQAAYQNKLRSKYVKEKLTMVIFAPYTLKATQKHHWTDHTFL